MALTTFNATAATCEVVPGTTETTADGLVHIRQQIFTDIVESQDPRIAGTNTPVLDIDLDQQSGTGALRGTFLLKPSAGDGEWEGELQGHFDQGLVRSSGIARGTGALGGSVLQVEFRQVVTYPGEPPCESPKASFEMNGMILE